MGHVFSDHTRVVVVGAGLAGLRVVERLRRRGFSGKLTMVGAENYEPYDRPPLSKDSIFADTAVAPRYLARSDLRTELGIDLRLGCAAVGVDSSSRRLRLADGRDVPYDTLVVTTGAAACRFPAAQSYPNVHMLRSYDDCLRLRRDLRSGVRLAIVGGGFIGCEVASGAVRHGLDVTVVEMQPVPLERGLGRAAGELMAELHRAHGVRLSTGVGVIRLVGTGKVKCLELTDGTRLPADVFLLGLGSAPATQWLLDSDVALDRGVLCDEYGRTSVPDVWAAGDVAQTLRRSTGRHAVSEHWFNAHEQGTIVADNILTGPDGSLTDTVQLPYFWSEQHGVRIQTLGHPDPAGPPEVVELDPAKPSLLHLYGTAGTLTSVVGLGAPAQLMRLRPFVGRPGSLDQARMLATAAPPRR